ncbi:MAG: hypothetical protein C4330_00900 [Chitinophagaceae bacterium]
MYIYPLQGKKPVVIPMSIARPNIVATDGYHFTKPIQVAYQTRVHYLKVSYAIDDDQLIAGGIIMFMLYLVGFTSGVFIITLFSISPLLFFLYLFYFNRKDFIRIQVA